MVPCDTAKVEDNGILINLSAALTVAVLGAWVATLLRQSPIVGYILGGVLIGPYTPGFHGDIHAVNQLAEIGVILLMFTVGVDLSLRRLTEAGRSALLGTPLQILIIIGISTGVGLAAGWASLEAVYYGAVIAISSSIILGRVLSERGEIGALHGRMAFAWSAVQDLSTVVLMVLLGTISAGGQHPLEDVAIAIGKALFFLALVLPFGSRVLPWAFERVARTRSRELFALTVAMVALGMAGIASMFGLSLALGAFIAGIVVSESDLSHQILGEIEPLRDIFAGMFFVSIGMLLDPVFMILNLPMVLVTMALILVVKGAVIIGIVMLFKAPVRTSVLTGFAMAQAGEFSFLLARLGADTGAVSEYSFGLMLSGSVGSILIAPAWYVLGHRLASWLDRRLRPSSLARHPALEEPDSLPRGHAVICGFGRVGQVVGLTLSRRGFSYIVIESDQNLVQRLRALGTIALLGNAENIPLLEQAALSRARVLVIALPDAIATRRIVYHARQLGGRFTIIARAHSVDEREYLLSHGVDEVVVGELELAIEMTRFTLQRFGVTAAEARAVVQRLRGSEIED